ncbi:hypothetical protein H0H93_009835, partial [Arthromyces matolae]
MALSKFFRTRLNAIQAATSSLLRRLARKDRTHAFSNRASKTPGPAADIAPSSLSVESSTATSDAADTAEVPLAEPGSSILQSKDTSPVEDVSDTADCLSNNIPDDEAAPDLETDSIVSEETTESTIDWLDYLDSLGDENIPARWEIWHPVNYGDLVVPSLDPLVPLEEERTGGYVAEKYYPVVMGDRLASRYQVVQKLGFGTTSTVWLARDMQERRHVALKIYKRDTKVGVDTGVVRELEVYEQLNQGPPSHPGKDAIRPLLDSLELTSPTGKH